MKCSSHTIIARVQLFVVINRMRFNPTRICLHHGLELPTFIKDSTCYIMGSDKKQKIPPTPPHIKHSYLLKTCLTLSVARRDQQNDHASTEHCSAVSH